MTNEERQEQAAKKMLDLAKNGLYGEVGFQVLKLPDGQMVYAIIFPDEKWDFDPERQTLIKKVDKIADKT